MERKYIIQIFVMLFILCISGISSSQINFEWQKKYDATILNTYGSGNPSFHCLTIDSSKNVYYAAFIDSNNKGQILLIKYNSSGEFKWSTTYEADAVSFIGQYKCFIKSDGINNIYIASRYSDSIGNYHILILKYDTNGTLVWERQYRNPQNEGEIPGGIILDNYGFIYIVGNIIDYSSNYKFLLLKYKYNGDFIWVRSVSSYSTGNGIITDNIGNVYVAGSVYSYSANKMFMMVAKYDSSGSLNWTRSYGIINSQPSSNDEAFAIALDDSNNVIVGGECYFNFCDWDYTTLKYRNNGDFVWGKSYHQGGVDEIWSIATDSKCNIYVTGINEANSLLVKYDCTGNQTGVLIPNNYAIWNVKHAGGKYIYVNGCKNYDTLSQIGLYFAKMDSNLSIVNSISFLVDSSKYTGANTIVSDKNGNIYLGGCVRYENTYPPYGDFVNPIIFKLSQVTGINNQNLIIPQSYRLYQNYPNPFNPTTRIKFDIANNPLLRGVGEARGVFTSLKVYDILGKEIATLVNEQLQPGTYEVTFDGSNLPSGIYFYQLSSNNELLATMKMMLIK